MSMLKSLWRRFRFQVQSCNLERIDLGINNLVFFEVFDLIDLQSSRVDGAITSVF